MNYKNMPEICCDLHPKLISIFAQKNNAKPVKSIVRVSVTYKRYKGSLKVFCVTAT
jgi:hypothetical protein